MDSCHFEILLYGVHTILELGGSNSSSTTSTHPTSSLSPYRNRFQCVVQDRLDLNLGSRGQTEKDSEQEIFSWNRKKKRTETGDVHPPSTSRTGSVIVDPHVHRPISLSRPIRWDRTGNRSDTLTLTHTGTRTCTHVRPRPTPRSVDRTSTVDSTHPRS